MRALNRKLLRDLWRMRAQVLAIAVVVASGVAVLVMSGSALEALQDSARAYYERYRFAQVFAGLKRAPEHLAERIAALPGVQVVQTRIARYAILDVAGFEEPVVGQLLSLPERGAPKLNRLALRAGRFPAPGRPNEAVLSEPFAEAHGLGLGDHLGALINGHQRILDVVGIALSPEFVYAIAPGSLMPDDRRFGVVWLGREALAAAYDLDGAFNDVSLSLLRGTDPRSIIERLDRLLERYGGVGAVARADQLSNWFLMNEIEQLGTVASTLPVIFLAVAAFLVNIVLARLIATERSEIGLMKAFGYTNLQVGWHYAKLAIAMTAVGIVLGWLVGAWLGRINTVTYAEFYRFPLLVFRPSPALFVIAALVSLAAALLGTLGAVRRAAALPPAEAMCPPAPPSFRKTVLGDVRFVPRLDHPTRIILRQVRRWPLRSTLTALGVALAVSVLVMANQWIDSINHIVQVFFFQAQRQDITVGLVEPQSSTVVQAFKRMPGVLTAEPARIVSARLHAGQRVHRGAILGVPAKATLQPIHDAKGEVLPVPPAGLVLATKLAEKLRVDAGDSVWVEVLEGRRPIRQVPVVRLIETYIGMPAYMDLAALNRLLLEPPSVEYLNLLVDEAAMAELFVELKALPEVSAVMLRQAAVDNFQETLAKTILVYVSFFAAFASALAFGVVYNTARIALSERGRELATLRVLGFRRAEVSYILLGEVALLTLLSLPVGCLLGRGLAFVMTKSFETELYRVPLVIEASTYGFAVLVVVTVTTLSALLVRRRVDRLDLIAVLKTRE